LSWELGMMKYIYARDAIDPKTNGSSVGL